MKVLLSHAYYLDEDEKEAKIMRPYPPLGLLYVSAYLTERNLENSVFDSTYSSFQEQLNHILTTKPKIVALYTNLMTKRNVIKLVKELKSKKEYGNPVLVLGGPDVTYNVENYLHAGVDFIIIGEGEETAFELFQAILNEQEKTTIPGIAFKANGVVKKTVGRVKIKDMTSLPIPNRSAIDSKKYLETWKNYHGQSSMTMSTQRGCPYTCKWCSTAVYGQSYRRRPAKLVVEEMAQLVKDYGPDAIWFVDDVFTVSHKWMASFFHELKVQNVSIPFECITRAERLNKELLVQLKEAGCFRIWIGAESGSQRIIDRMDRRVDVDMVKQVIQMTNQVGIESGTFIMVGYPTETLRDIDKTIQYLIEAKPTHYTITKAYPIKGTALYEEIENTITSDLDWETSTDREIEFKRTYSSRFYDLAISYIQEKVEMGKANLPWNIRMKKQVKILLLRIRMLVRMNF